MKLRLAQRRRHSGALLVVALLGGCRADRPSEAREAAAPAAARGAGWGIARNARGEFAYTQTDAPQFPIGINHVDHFFYCDPIDTVCTAADLPRTLYRDNRSAALGVALQQFRAWGFTSAGYSPVGQLRRRLPYYQHAPLLNISYWQHPPHPGPWRDEHGPLPTGVAASNGSWMEERITWRDPFAPATIEDMHRRMSAACAETHSTRHNLLGYIWTDCPVYDLSRARKLEHTDWVSWLRCQKTEGKRQYLSFLQQNVSDGGSAATVCARYGISAASCSSWDALASSDTLCQLNSSSAPTALLEDDYRFLPLLVDQLYSSAHASLRACDEQSVLVGDTFIPDVWTPDSVVEVAGRYVDATSWQPQDTIVVSQSNRFNLSEWRRLHELSGGKPIVIQDFNAAFHDARYPRTEWETMPTQEAAAEVYSNWVTACARSGFVIAFNKCMYIDRFHTLWDGSLSTNATFLKQGMLSAEGEPHEPFVAMVTEANHNAHDLKLARFAASKTDDDDSKLPSADPESVRCMAVGADGLTKGNPGAFAKQSLLPVPWVGSWLQGNDMGIHGHRTPGFRQCNVADAVAKTFGWNWSRGTTEKACATTCPYMSCYYQFSFEAVHYGVSAWGGFVGPSHLPRSTVGLTSILVSHDISYSWVDTKPVHTPPIYRSRLIYDFFLTNEKPEPHVNKASNVTDEIVISLANNAQFALPCGYHGPHQTAHPNAVQFGRESYDLVDISDYDRPDSTTRCRMSHFRRVGSTCASGESIKLPKSLDLLPFIKFAQGFQPQTRPRPAGDWLGEVSIGTEIYDETQGVVEFRSFNVSLN